MIKDYAALEPQQKDDDDDLPVGTKLAGGQFEIIGSLGTGGFGVTYRARDTVLGRIVVIKECFPSACSYRDGLDVVATNNTHAVQLRSIVDMFMHEARSLAKLRHPNIVGVHRAFEENQTAYMVLDLIDGHDLLDIIHTPAASLSPSRVNDILLQLLDAVEQVHNLDLLHRDISPDNVILEKSGTPVLIDFGAARADASRRTRAISALLVVKDGYSPQEFYVSGSLQTRSSDIYALGATFYHLLSGNAPPSSQARMVEVAGNKPDPCPPLVGRIEGYEPEFLEAIDMAMQLHQSERIQSAAQWRNMISTATPGAAPIAISPARKANQRISLDLERSLTRLVEETNDEVKKAPRVAVETKVIEAVQEKPPLPEWVEEFNQDSLARRSSDGSKQTSLGVPATPLPDTPAETNWVTRAIEKQERLRNERMAEFSATLSDAPPKRPKSAALPVLAPVDEIPEPSPRRSFASLLAYVVVGLILCGLLFYGTISVLP